MLGYFTEYVVTNPELYFRPLQSLHRHQSSDHNQQHHRLPLHQQAKHIGGHHLIQPDRADRAPGPLCRPPAR